MKSFSTADLDIQIGQFINWKKSEGKIVAMTNDTVTIEYIEDNLIYTVTAEELAKQNPDLVALEDYDEEYYW